MSRRYPPRFSGGRPLDGVPLCREKLSYSTWSAATKAAGRTRVDAGEGPALSAFHCRDCGRFHTGNNMLGGRR